MNLAALPAFGLAQAVHVVIEAPRGSTVKLKYDSSLESFTLSRPLPEGLAFPCDWGFIPSTRGPDGDPVDAMVAWDRPTWPGVVLACRLVGVVGVEQNSKHHPGQRERNDRVIAVPLASPRHASISGVDDLPERFKVELEAFFLASTALEHKELAILGWSGPEVAYELVRSFLAQPQ
jgi:inorganic pyrophosphatase